MKRLLFLALVILLGVTSVFIFRHSTLGISVPESTVVMQKEPTKMPLITPKAEGQIPVSLASNVADSGLEWPKIQDISADSETQKKLTLLQEVLASKNDNDPRLDKGFKDLSKTQKRSFEKYYFALKPERLNERGTIVFILGSQINEPADFDFFSKVVIEKPCLSLNDCAKESHAPDPEHAHLESTLGVTLAYPQMVALNRTVKFLTEHPDLNQNIKESAINVIRQGVQSSSQIVAKKAAEMLPR